MEQVFFNVPLFKLEPIFKKWMREVQDEQTATKGTAPQDELLTIEQAAAFLSLSVPTLYTKTSTGQIPFMKRGKRLYFSRVELMEYLKAGRHKTRAEQIAEAGQHLKTKGGNHE